ncbi:MAG: NADH-quinone oxidoreductase subunit H [Capsulimonadaceae bacterium]|nr:NADH-quinone oxidoreductase subunit H [Capsulimonadaceae bacterium]
MDFSQFSHIFWSVPTNEVPAADWWIDVLRAFVRILVPVFFVLLLVPPLVWFERRLLGFMQQRQGPNRVGPEGIVQTIADGVKLLMKEDIIPSNVDRTLYVLAPIIMLIPALVTAGVLPWHPSLVWGAGAPNVDIGVLYLLAWSSLAVYGVVMAGWASNNKYALLGGLRSSAQMISYELGMGIAVVTVVLISGALSVRDIVFDQSAYGWIKDAAHTTAHHAAYTWGIVHKPWLGFLNPWHVAQFFPMGFVAAFIYVVAMLAETNRSPFDLPEAETELVAGYHTEYTSMKFAMFFMGEYANMVVVSAIAATLFFGGWTTPIAQLDQWDNTAVGWIIPAAMISAKIGLGLYFFVWIRATLPRIRYDMLMSFGWKGIFPIALGNLFCVAVSLTAGYWAGLAVWIVLAVGALLIVANLDSTKRFTEKTRRRSVLGLYASAQPFQMPLVKTSNGAPPVDGRTAAEELVK